MGKLEKRRQKDGKTVGATECLPKLGCKSQVLCAWEVTALVLVPQGIQTGTEPPAEP